MAELLNAAYRRRRYRLRREVDLNRRIQPSRCMTSLVRYNRFDVFDLKVNRSRLEPNFLGRG